MELTAQTAIFNQETALQYTSARKSTHDSRSATNPKPRPPSFSELELLIPEGPMLAHDQSSATWTMSTNPRINYCTDPSVPHREESAVDDATFDMLQVELPVPYSRESVRSRELPFPYIRKHGKVEQQLKCDQVKDCTRTSKPVPSKNNSLVDAQDLGMKPNHSHSGGMTAFLTVWANVADFDPEWAAY
mmetsp:Transcript_65724/g.176096  ORF Transcript_65724/g.176096 Transcript_65724/m.176096 type:complete len:189 (+) Transcript_65724:175-741(+)